MESCSQAIRSNERSPARRTTQNWIGGSDFSPRGASYVPPPCKLLEALLDDLVAATRVTDVSIIAQAAIIHAEFESIHPYADGNGRIGRAMINAVLRYRGLTSNVVVPIGSVMLADVDRYFAQLDQYRSGDVDGLVRYMADAAVTAAAEAVTSADHLVELPDRWRADVRANKGSAADKLLDRLLEVPVLTDKSAASAVGASTRRIYDALNRLTEAGIVTEVTGNERDRVWVAGDVLMRSTASKSGSAGDSNLPVAARTVTHDRARGRSRSPLQSWREPMHTSRRRVQAMSKRRPSSAWSRSRVSRVRSASEWMRDCP